MQTAQITHLEGDRKINITITQQDRFTAFHDGRWMNLQLFFSGRVRLEDGENIGVLQFWEYERKLGEQVAKQLPEPITIVESDDGNYYLTVTDELVRMFDPLPESFTLKDI